jgi:SSS family solute:Na+ symporter
MLLAWSITGITFLVDPAFYQRVFAASSARSVQGALAVGILLWASFDWGVTLLGIIAKSAVEQGMLPTDLQGKQALLTVCMQMLPTGLRGLMIGGILAAAMSQIDSYALLASGNLIYDIYRPVIDPNAPDRRLLNLTRLGVFIVMAASALISLMFVRMRDAWQFMASIMASVVLVPAMGALFTRPKPAAGLMGAIFGFVGLIAFYAILFTNGHYDLAVETYLWKIGDVEIWQDYAVLCALPVSLAGFILGNVVGKLQP